MALNQVVKGVNFSNRHGRPEPQGNFCIRPVILDVCARYQAHRILCLRCGNQKPDHDRQEAGCAVGMKCSGNGTANSFKWSSANEFPGGRLGSPCLAEESGVDLVVDVEVNDLHLKASELIDSVDQSLHPKGILMIALPVWDAWEMLWITARAWWDYWNGSDARFWSRQALSALLESRGFTILESIKVRVSSQRQAIVLVARKTGPSDPTSA
ncbi:MAG: hypothetical protein IPM89_15275 [Candidatus Competibacteraceae bacterium]|nr:MAG: hypothetical protein IPM89_15275 [Candidatus Competibacteraceae bacterium]